MNQDQVKEKLLQLAPDVDDFRVIFSGKKSKKVNGLYKVENREIIIHNRNFPDNDNAIIYTAIHELAHHIQFTRSALPISTRCHTRDFYTIFHGLLYKAEELGIYNNIYTTKREFIQLTERIKNDFILKNGNLIKEFGQILLEAHKLCDKHGVSFNDYVDRVLNQSHTNARYLIRLANYDLNPAVGYENMKTLASISDQEQRKAAENDFLAGLSPYIIKSKYKVQDQTIGTREKLEKEKVRIERTISSLQKRLDMINQKINELQTKNN